MPHPDLRLVEHHVTLRHEPNRFIDSVERLVDGTWQRVPWRRCPLELLQLWKDYNWPPERPVHVVSTDPLSVVWKYIPNMGDPVGHFEQDRWWQATLQGRCWSVQRCEAPAEGQVLPVPTVGAEDPSPPAATTPLTPMDATSTVTSLGEALRALETFDGPAEQFELSLPEHLHDPVGMNVAVLTDRALARGWEPAGVRRTARFRCYLYKRMDGAPPPATST